MKKSIILLLSILSLATINASVPQSISYQAVVRNSANALVVNSNIGMQISVLQNSATGTAVYIERHFPTTNANGLVSLQIGTGTVVFGSLPSIDWSLGTYFVKSDYDLNGGANYTISGTSQILSVPYAMYAQTAENAFSGNFTDLKNKPTTLSGFGISDEVNGKIASLKAEINIQIATLTAEINILKNKVATLEALGDVDAGVAAAIAIAKADIMSKVVTLESFNAYKATVTDDLAALTTKVNAAATEVELTALETAVYAKIVAIESALVALGAKVTNLQTNLNNLGTIVDGVIVKIDKNTADIAALKADNNFRFAILEGVLNIQAGKSVVLDVMKTELASQLALISANMAKIADLQNRLINLEKRITVLELK